MSEHSEHEPVLTVLDLLGFKGLGSNPNILSCLFLSYLLLLVR